MQELPGELRQHPELLSNFTLPAASPFLLESAYWLPVTKDSPIVAEGTSQVMPGDFLLIETVSRWTRRPEAYLGGILALRFPDGRGTILAKSRREEEEFEVVRQHALNTFVENVEARLFPLLTRSEIRKKQPESTTGGSRLIRLYVDDVVGVVLQRVSFLENWLRS